MDSRDDRLERPYSEAELKALARVLDIPELSDEHTARLQRAALEYIFFAEYEREPKPGDKGFRLKPLARERRKALLRVKRISLQLKEALKSRALLFLEENDKLPFFDTDNLEKLAEAAEKAAKRKSRSGPKTGTARSRFVRDLAAIYHEVKRKPPKRRHNPITQKDYGPFLKFVEVALGVLDPAALNGIDHVVRHVCKEFSEVK